MMMPGRNTEYSWSRMGYNGQAKDDEVYGKGNLNTAMFWEMDTRLMRRWNLDPLDQINVSNYAVNKNNPIALSDPFGDSPDKGDSDADPIVLKDVVIHGQDRSGGGLGGFLREAFSSYIAMKSLGDNRIRNGNAEDFIAYHLERDRRNVQSAMAYNAGIGKNYPWGVTANKDRVLGVIGANLERVLQNSFLNYHGTSYSHAKKYYDKGGYGEVITSSSGEDLEPRISQYKGPYTMAYYNSAPGGGGGFGSLSNFGEAVSNWSSAFNQFWDFKTVMEAGETQLQKANIPDTFIDINGGSGQLKTLDGTFVEPAEGKKIWDYPER